MNPLQMVDLKSQYQRIKPQIDNAIQGVIDSCQFVKGAEVKTFEQELAQYLGVRHAIACGNGTDALQVALMALGLKPGDEVITTDFTFIATVEVIALLGLKPVLVDVDRATFNIDVEKVEKAITPRTKAIVPVHVYGHPCDVEGFARLGETYGVKIIYDAAHAFGETLGGRSIAAYGDMAMFSFHPTKLFHSCEGGLLTFKDAALQEKLFNLRNFAIRNELECVDVGTNAKMNELQALMGLECLKAMEPILASRAAIHAAYRQAFGECGMVRFVDPRSFASDLGFVSNFAYCPILFRDFEARERVYAALKEKCNVFARRYFYPLLTDFAPYLYGRGSCPVAEDAARRVLTLPTFFDLDPADATRIAENIREVL